MKNAYFLLFTVLSITFFGCSSGKKAYEQGDYYGSVIKSVNRLRKNENHKKSKATLSKSYPLALKTLERNASNAMASNAPFKYKTALRTYQRINRLANEIQRSPGALRVIPNPKSFHSEIANLKQQAAKESYDAAVIALKKDTREDAKEAYLLFRDVQEFVPGYKDVVDMSEDALFQATLKVVVEQIPVPSRYTLSSNFFKDQIESHLHSKYGKNKFVRFYTPKEAKQTKLPYVDQYLKLQFDDFVVGETHTVKTIETFSRDSVVVGTVKLDDGTEVDAYNTVTAKLTVWQKEVISKGLFSMQVIDANGKAVLTHKKFTGEFVWFSEWGSFNGDERALTSKQLNICKRSEVPPPRPQKLFIEFTKPIYNQLIPTLNSFYSQY